MNISNIKNIYFTKITKRDFLYSEINKIENEKKIAAKSGIAIEYLTVSPYTGLAQHLWLSRVTYLSKFIQLLTVYT